MEKEMIERYMEIAINEAKKAYKKNEIPVGSIIVKNNEVIAKSHNKRDNTNIVIEHAEISAIIKANKKLNNWRLNDSILFTTLEPCDMCKSVIKESKIKIVYFAANRDKNESKSEVEKNVEYIQIENKLLISEAEKLIKDKFKELRKK